jgi:hypothetical protein
MDKKEEITKGWDRDVDYKPMKKKLIKEFEQQQTKFKKSPFKVRATNKLIYLIISMTQLRNGCRVSEAINAFRMFIKDGIKEKVTVKIGKSDGTKYKFDKNTNKKIKFKTKARYRQIMFPITWFKDRDIYKFITKVMASKMGFLEHTDMKRRIANYMKRNHGCNTHSLRYAFINYMIYEEKRPLNDVAKFVGHVDLSQLVTYTQRKNCDQIFDLDI